MQMTYRLTKCQLTASDTLKINIAGQIPKDIDAILNHLKSANEVVSTLALKAWESITFVGTQVIKKVKNFLQIILTVKRSYVPFAEVKFARLGYPGTDSLSKSLANTTRQAVAILAANYLLEKNLVAVVVHYKEGGRERSLRVLNYNLYKNINPGDSRFETFILGTGCLLFKS